MVDDDITFTKILKNFLKKNGYEIEIAHSVKDALPLLGQYPYCLFLLDYRLPDGTGFDIMSAAKEQSLNIPAVIMTSFNDVRTAVKSMRLGAFDYITKPVNQEELLMIVEQALQGDKVSELALERRREVAFVEGESPESQKLHELIRLIAPTEMSVILQGESGTGKEYAARLIHDLSERAGKPFVAVDCGALSQELSSSELFGHLKGAFTGALQDKKGKFEHAQKGTLFLDEIGNLQYEVQVKLLRVLQERIVQPVGSNKEIKVDVRIIVATNDDLNNSVNEGKFREDLYHRLNEFKIMVPPLRKRGADLFLLIDHFIKEANLLLKRNVKAIAPEVLHLLQQYDWPGNIRELKNIVKRLVLLAKSDVAGMEGLPEEMLLNIKETVPGKETDLKAIQEDKEKMLIEKVLQEVKFNKSKAAKLLNIDRSTLYAKMEKYNLN